MICISNSSRKLVWTRERFLLSFLRKFENTQNIENFPRSICSRGRENQMKLFLEQNALRFFEICLIGQGWRLSNIFPSSLGRFESCLILQAESLSESFRRNVFLRKKTKIFVKVVFRILNLQENFTLRLLLRRCSKSSLTIFCANFL